MWASMKSLRQGSECSWAAADERNTVCFIRWAFSWVPITLAKVGSMQSWETKARRRCQAHAGETVGDQTHAGGRAGGRMGGQDSGRRRLQGCGQDSRCQAGHAYPETRRSSSGSRPAPVPREKPHVSAPRDALLSLVTDYPIHQLIVFLPRSLSAPKRNRESPRVSLKARGGRGPG